MNVRQSLACVREACVSTAMAPSDVSVLRARHRIPRPMPVKTVMSVPMKTPVSTAAVLTPMAVSTAAATQDSFLARIARPA